MECAKGSSELVMGKPSVIDMRLDPLGIPTIIKTKDFITPSPGSTLRHQNEKAREWPWEGKT